MAAGVSTTVACGGNRWVCGLMDGWGVRTSRSDLWYSAAADDLHLRKCERMRSNTMSSLRIRGETKVTEEGGEWVVGSRSSVTFARSFFYLCVRALRAQARMHIDSQIN